MTVSAKKYQFHEAFDGGKGDKEAQSLAAAKIEWEEATKAREIAAFEQGRADALAGLETDIKAQMAVMLEHLTALAADRAQLVETVEIASIEVAEMVATKIADILISRSPGRLVAETVMSSLPLVIGEARIVVRLAEPLVEHIKNRLDEMVMEAGFTGQIVLLGDERILPGDCRIEWANGGIERRASDITSEIQSTIENFLRAAPSDTRPSETPEENTDQESQGQEP